MSAERLPGDSSRASGLARVEIALLHAATVLVGGTGLVYAAMRYLLPPADEWAIVNHPAQPAVQHLHVVLAPLLVLALGYTWRLHAARLLRTGVRERRLSGLVLLLGSVPMVASGVLLQVAASPAWRDAWGLVHTLTSLAWLAAIVLHLVAHRAPPAPPER